MKTCRACKFWNGKTAKPNANGKCKRYPPQIIYAKGGDWCGEFKPRKRLVGVNLTPTGEQYIYSDS